jgi:hypothetical protein
MNKNIIYITIFSLLILGTFYIFEIKGITSLLNYSSEIKYTSIKQTLGIEDRLTFTAIRNYSFEVRSIDYKIVDLYDLSSNKLYILKEGETLDLYTTPHIYIKIDKCINLEYIDTIYYPNGDIKMGYDPSYIEITIYNENGWQ